MNNVWQKNWLKIFEGVSGKCGNRFLTQESLRKLGMLFHKSDDLRKVRQFAEKYKA